eukprot:TRINITY_DN4428_c0_g2_i1.p1 TRINITY_DN4428_c0_g2~~TRINITY_DN4428_c0_g2_i1.p1  ORF type:complete len:540 (+),score=120.83 TRINITY_DN4428_c0_g2_i1:102-1721(+)
MAEDDGGRAKKRRKTDDTATAASRTDAVQYHCDYCQKDISNCLRISCAVCAEFDLCVECFSVGVELKGHKNEHDFRIIDNMHFPFLSEDWGADEELLLLEGLEINGYGNWEDVAEHITTKTKREVEEHYLKYYRNAPGWPSVDLSKVLSTRADVMRLNGLPYRQDAPRADSTTTKKSNPKFTPSHPVKAELSNFMPMRGEFEIEWDNEAEMPIKDLEVDSRDTPEEKEIKVKLFQIYNARVEEREEKRRFVLERGLHDVKRMAALEKKRTKEERDLYQKTRKFATVMSQAEWDDYVKNILAEKMLRAKISELQTLRANGVRTMVDADLYRKEMRKREADKNKWRSATRSRGWEAPPAPADKKNKSLAASMGPGATGLTGGSGVVSAWSPALKPGYELLGDSEKSLCEVAKISPVLYLNTKEILIREALSQGGSLSLEQAKAAVPKLDAPKLAKIFDYLVECNWLQKSTSAVASSSSSQMGSASAGSMAGMGGGSLIPSQKPHFSAHHGSTPGHVTSGRITLTTRGPVAPIPGVGRPVGM